MNVSESENVKDIATTDVIFLGAGFSRAVTEGVSPLMSDFFADLDRRRFWDLWSFLELFCDEPKRANVEQALLTLDQLAISPLDGVEPFFDEVRKRHRQVRDELDEHLLGRLGRLPMKSDWAVRILATASAATTVITTNYDNLAERILSSQTGLRHRTADTNCHHCKLCAILGDECKCDGAPQMVDAWRGSLLKLHGSISWRRCKNLDCAMKQCLLPDQHCRPFSNEVCPTCDGPCGPVLVPPSMVKSFDNFRGLKQVWNSAYTALSAANSVLFWGFSFPASDVLIRQMIRSSLTHNKRAVDIGVIDINPEKPAMVLQELLGGNDRDGTTISLYEVPESGTEPPWLVRKTSTTPSPLPRRIAPARRTNLRGNG